MNLSWQPLSDQVVNWLVLLRSGRATPADHASFVAWRAADPRNESAWQQLNDTLRSSGETGRLSDAYPYANPETHDKPATRGVGQGLNRRHFLGGLLALGGATVAGAAAVNAYYPLAGLGNDMATQTGERRLYRLSDGSQMLLDARTRINLSYTASERTLQLVAGALSLTAQPDPGRPLLIRTGEGLVQALGARVVVRQQARRTLVIAPDNEVEIETSSGTRQIIPAGTGTRFDNTRIGEPRADLLADAAWENGWIEARDRPLAEVITALRPYREGVLRISMAAGGLLARGRYPLDDTNAALRALEADMPIQVHRITPWFTAIDVASV
ncbi:MAG TPA: FecR domain-containing protein [Bordetella sp.]